MTLRDARRWAGLMMLGGAAALAAGCFRERTIPMEPGELRRPAPLPAGSSLPDTRAWLRHFDTALRPLVPRWPERVLLTEELTDPDGRPVDPYRHFDYDPDKLSSVFHNFYGLQDTAQASHTTVPEREPPTWPGFEDVWVPVDRELRIYGRLGLAMKEGRPIRSDCVVILPGLLGDLSVERTRTIARALVDSGLHALALELRGYGETDKRYPDVPYNFGVLETGDLMAVAEWLQNRPEVDRTGMIGFCWGANQALLVAWNDGRAEDAPIISPRLRPFMRSANGRRVYEAGVIAFSPVLGFEHIIEATKTPSSFMSDPVMDALQDGIRERKVAKRYTPVDGDLRALIDAEFARSIVNHEGAVRDGLDVLRFMPYQGMPSGDKLVSARIPVLIVHAANDPLAAVHFVGELISQTPNPMVAAILLPGGGHVGFGPWSRAFFYSTILGFFDRERGAAAMISPADGPVAAGRATLEAEAR